MRRNITQILKETYLTVLLLVEYVLGGPPPFGLTPIGLPPIGLPLIGLPPDLEPFNQVTSDLGSNT